ncbi:Pkinase-domain-containing protein [Hypoxylon trugodes]|uniref:Pkinase-domain-containing protein n=1 Tax=Hypoxylon trugodes TaxID=326681 RepID=UPI002196A6FF|nr:Pkinase-domain-containing protein [Hypoxylon trugodes]KAI1392069.1 Pkinase-domain-containing protein [Hypoxylon trugodes]
MADRRGKKPQALRAPLGDATARVNNTASKRPTKSSRAQDTQPNPLRSHPTNTTRRNVDSDASTTVKPNATHAHTSHAAQQALAVQDILEHGERIPLPGVVPDPKRRKTHVGPWELGKTLGAGSAARVRLVRHNITGQLAAVKILSRHTENMTQPGSIAELDKWDRTRAEYHSENRIPFTIEREVAIMKLIDHPHIVKLYDIWENRSEIYLVLEYVERGDFHSYLGQCGPLSEVEAMYFFRQLLGALDYVHSFNICHRDLKPENILVTEDCQLKISDFGMSAMHQGPNHLLRTSCGSPHYAAPELLSPGAYKGDKSDIWSLGIILYGCLCNALPFNHENVPTLLGMVKAGKYHMPAFFSPEAKDLIRRMLTMDPAKRIPSKEIWKHPLLRKYDHLDNFNDGEKRHDYRQNARYDPVPADELDAQALRQLKSVWHTYTEKQIAAKLTSTERNDFKLFYWLLCGYREKRLENYGTDLSYSPSDYHHLQPANWKKKYTTLEFPAQHGRTMSRFTVISNVAIDEDGKALEVTSADRVPDRADTIKSYDPYKSSHVMEDVFASRAKIVVHRNGTTSTRASKAPSIQSGSTRTNSTHTRRTRSGKRGKPPVVTRGSRRSLNSIKSGEEISYKRPTSRHKRGVNFSYAHKRSVGQAEGGSRPASVAGDGTVYDRNFSYPTSPGRRMRLSRNSARTRSGTQSVVEVPESQGDHLYWNEELHHFSRSIAKDCDDAFNSILLSSAHSLLDEATFESSVLEDSGMFLPGINVPSRQSSTQELGQVDIYSPSSDGQSLPPPPPPKDPGIRGSKGTRRRAGRTYGEEAVSPSTRPAKLTWLPPKVEVERRVVSAPIYSQYSTQWGKDRIPLPSIHETPREDSKYRVVSAPAESSATQTFQAQEGMDLEYFAQQGDTIRIVNSPTSRRNWEPVRSPSVSEEPSQGAQQRPQTRRGFNTHQQYETDEKGATTTEPSAQVGERSSSFNIRKKSSWFRRNSKDKEAMVDGSSTGDLNRMKSNSSIGQPAPAKKKRSFNFSFWRSNKEPEMKLSIADESDSDDEPDFDDPSHPYYKKWNDKVATRNIEPQQNWFARLFRVKPATRYICFSFPRNRVRREIAILLKEWRRHGMKDVVVDKERNLVFARVGKKNSLNMKEAAFAAEIMTVIEHGRRSQLCIVRFTQERGAASTFHKVVDTMDEIFNSRGLLVLDKYKIKMMIKTLNS